MKTKLILASLILALTPKSFGATCGRIVDVPLINDKGIFVVYQGEHTPFRADNNIYNLSLLLSTLGTSDRNVCLGEAAVAEVEVYEPQFNGHVPHAASDFSGEICGAPVLLEMSPKLLDKPDRNGMAFTGDAWVMLKSSDPKGDKAKGGDIVSPSSHGANVQLLISVYAVDRFLPAFAATVGRPNVELCFSPSKRNGTFELTGARPASYGYLK